MTRRDVRNLVVLSDKRLHGVEVVGPYDRRELDAAVERPAHKVDRAKAREATLLDARDDLPAHDRLIGPGVLGARPAVPDPTDHSSLGRRRPRPVNVGYGNEVRRSHLYEGADDAAIASAQTAPATTNVTNFLTGIPPRRVSPMPRQFSVRRYPPGGSHQARVIRPHVERSRARTRWHLLAPATQANPMVKPDLFARRAKMPPAGGGLAALPLDSPGFVVDPQGQVRRVGRD